MYFKNIILFVLLYFSNQAVAKLVATPQDILKTYCPQDCSIEEKNILLTEDEVKKVSKLAQQLVHDKIFKFYLVKKKNKDFAWAGLVTQKIRAKDMTALYIIQSPGLIDAIEMVAFYESPEYMPQKTWLQNFKGKNDSQNLAIRGGIPNISGATLSAESVATSAALILAIWKVKFGALK